MQRRNFLTVSTAATATVASAAVATAFGTSTNSLSTGPKVTEQAEKPFIVKAGEARFDKRTLFRGVNPNELKVASKDTNGMLTIFEYAGKEKIGPPLHVHSQQDEIFYILEGEYLFQVGDDKFMAKAGDTVFGPRNIAHTWVQRSDTGKMMYLVQPAGTMEEFFAELSQLKGPPTEAQVQKIHQAHGMTVLGPPLSPK